jgi:hypothetical protein
MGKYAAWFNSNDLKFAGNITVVMMLPALKHGLLKALSDFAMHTQAWCPQKL